MMKCSVIDFDMCMGCYYCQIACKDEHCNNDWSRYAKPQPMHGQFWLNISQAVRGTLPKVKVSYLPRLCMHCDDAPCVMVCGVEGAIYKRDDGLVIIDPEKCTGCAHLLDDDWEVPRCADACPTDAIIFGKESELKGLIKKAEVLNPESMTQPRVYYKGLPKKFVGGTVYDPDRKEVVTGATCVLKDRNGDDAFEAKTDKFGDFWFQGLEDDRTFTLTIEQAGMTKTIDAINTAKDVNLKDIPFF
jgi:Fe-S-cluster-containing dehydrogenase component